jgi:hypothetical protein
MNFSISSRLFYQVLGLIVLLPIVAKSPLLVLGVATQGEVVDHRWIASKSKKYASFSTYAIIEFKADQQVIRMAAMQNVDYSIGDKVTILYKQQDPLNCMILSIASIYLSYSAVIPAVLLILWAGMYRTFRKENLPQEAEPVHGS